MRSLALLAVLALGCTSADAVLGSARIEVGYGEGDGALRELDSDISYVAVSVQPFAALEHRAMADAFHADRPAPEYVPPVLDECEPVEPEPEPEPEPDEHLLNITKEGKVSITDVSALAAMLALLFGGWWGVRKYRKETE